MGKLVRRGLDNILVKILASTDISTVTSCLLVNSSWNSHLRHIWRQLYRERQKDTRFRKYCGLTAAIELGFWENCLKSSEYRRILVGGKKWSYFSKCSFSIDRVPTCFKYFRNQLYFGTVEGELKSIDFGNHNLTNTLQPSSDSGRIFSIDIKDDLLVTGHGDGSIRFTPEWRGLTRLQVTSCPLPLLKILPSRERSARILCWDRDGHCQLLSSLTDINIIGR